MAHTALVAKIAVMFGGETNFLMYQTERLPVFSHGFYWEISGFTGSLLRSSKDFNRKKIISPKIPEVLVNTSNQVLS